MEDWKTHHKEAMKVRDYETVLAECRQLAIMLHEMATAVLHEFLADNPDSLGIEQRLKVIEVSEQGLRLLGTVLEDGRAFSKKYTVDGHDLAEACLENLNRINRKLLLTCPDADIAAIDAARDQVEHGNSLSFEEAFPDAFSAAPAA